MKPCGNGPRDMVRGEDSARSGRSVPAKRRSETSPNLTLVPSVARWSAHCPLCGTKRPSALTAIEHVRAVLINQAGGRADGRVVWRGKPHVGQSGNSLRALERDAFSRESPLSGHSICDRSGLVGNFQLSLSWSCMPSPQTYRAINPPRDVIELSCLPSTESG